MPALTYSVSDFQAFTKIRSADVNARFTDISTLLNTTKLDDDNIQDAGITRGTKLSAGTADYVVINDGSGNLSEEAQLNRSRGGTGINTSSLTGKQGQALVVNSGETAFELATVSADKLKGSSAAEVVTVTAGEAIAANDAVCLILNEGSYKVVPADEDILTRRFSFFGFATAAATVTAGVYTWTDSADLVTGNTITWEVNGREFTQAFTTDNDTTLAAIATQIQNHADVQSAVVTDNGSQDRVITVTGKGGLTVNITGAGGTGNPAVTGGASQATVTIAETTAASGDSVVVQTYGLLDGFSGMTVGNPQYISGTAGGITETPNSPPIQVGQAWSSTVMFITGGFKLGFKFEQSGKYTRAYGSSGSPSWETNNKNDGEEFDFTSWAAITAPGFTYSLPATGDGKRGGTILLIGGINTSDVAQDDFLEWDGASWTTNTVLTSALNEAMVGSRAGVTDVFGGTGSGQGGSPQDVVYTWDGASWTSHGAIMTNSGRTGGAYNRPTAGKTAAVAYANNTTIYTNHDEWNGASISAQTAFPGSGKGWAGSGTISDNGLIWANGTSATGYTWNGSAWSSGITMQFSPQVQSGTASAFGGGMATGFSSGNQTAYLNGRRNGSGAAEAVTQRFNGVSSASETSSTNARAGSGGGMRQ